MAGRVRQFIGRLSLAVLLLLGLGLMMRDGFGFGDGRTRGLIRGLSDPSLAVRRNAALALGRRVEPREVDEVVDALIGALGDPSASVQEVAATSLAAHGPEAAEAIPAFLALLDHRDERVREGAAYALGQITVREDPRWGEVASALDAAMDDPSLEVRLLAMRSQWEMGGRVRVRPSVIALVTDSHIYLRRYVIRAIARNLEHDPEATRSLLIALGNDGGTFYRHRAAALLERMGESEEAEAIRRTPDDVDEQEVGAGPGLTGDGSPPASAARGSSSSP